MSTEDLRRRRKAAREALAWGAARSGVAGAAPGIISIPGVLMNDLVAYRAIYVAYFDREPTAGEVTDVLKRRALVTTILLKSASTFRGLFQVLNVAPNPVTTPFAVAACATSTATGAAIFMAGCEYIYRSEHAML